MKKWLFLLFGVAVIVALYLLVIQLRVTPIWAMPKYAKVTRGDIRVPITAPGVIRANQEIDVKSMASGRIKEGGVPVVAGDFVRAKQPLVVLDPIDEQRSVERAKADFDRAEALLDQAKVAVERAQVAIETANSRLAEIQAQNEVIRFEYEKVESGDKQSYSAQEIHDIRARYQMGQAQEKSARIAITSAELSKKDAEAAAKSQAAIVVGAKATLDDANKRFSETTVLAPQEAIVTDVYVRPGMLVQSATGSFTGGTLLMKLADVSKKEVVAKVDEADYGRVLDVCTPDSLPDFQGLREAAEQDAEQLEKRSGVVRITVDAFPEETFFEGRVTRVEPQGKNNPGSSVIQFDVHVEITDAKRHMLPLGAQAQVEFTVESATSVLRVPADAVKTVDGKSGVYVKAAPLPGSDEKFGKRFVRCRLGISDGEFTEVLDTPDDKLNEGDEVYTKLPQENTEES